MLSPWPDWLADRVRTLALGAGEAVAVARAVEQGLVPPPALRAKRAPLQDPLLCEPLPRDSGNGVFCLECKHLTSAKATAWSNRPEDEDDDDDAMWRAAFTDGSDSWYYEEPGGRVPGDPTLVLQWWPVLTSDNNDLLHEPPDDIDGWCAANRRAREATRRGAVASVVLTSQFPITSGRCAWCRSERVRHCTVRASCRGVFCAGCSTVFCGHCTPNHNCPSRAFRAGDQDAKHEPVPVRNMGDYSEWCEAYYARTYPKQYARRCQVLVDAPPLGWIEDATTLDRALGCLRRHARRSRWWRGVRGAARRIQGWWRRVAASAPVAPADHLVARADPEDRASRDPDVHLIFASLNYDVGCMLSILRTRDGPCPAVASALLRTVESRHRVIEDILGRP